MKISNSSIKNEIEEIMEIKEELQDESTFAFNYPVNDVEIEQWEKTNNIKIPEQYKDWLRFSNGSKIDGEFAVFFGLDKLIVNRDEFDEPIVIIGSMVGDGEVLAFSIKTGEILKILEGRVRRFESFRSYLQFLIDVL